MNKETYTVITKLEEGWYYVLGISYLSEKKVVNISNRIKSENRESKIDAIVNGKEFVEMKLEDDPEYKENWKLIPVEIIKCFHICSLFLSYIY